MLWDLPVDIIQPIAVIWNKYLLHDGQLCQPVSTHLDKFHESTAGHFTLTQTDSRQLRAALGDADQLFIQRPQPIGTHHQLDQTRAGEPNAAQHVFTDGAAEVQMRYRDFIAEERAKLVLIEEEVHHQIKFWRVAHHGIPATLLNGVKLLARILANNINAKVLEMNVLLRGEGNEKFITQQMVVESQFSQAMALISHAQDAWDRGQRKLL